MQKKKSVKRKKSKRLESDPNAKEFEAKANISNANGVDVIVDDVDVVDKITLTEFTGHPQTFRIEFKFI